MGQAKQEKEDDGMQIRIASTDCQDRTASTRLLIKDCQDRTTRTRLQCRTAKTGPPGHDFRDRQQKEICYDIALLLALFQHSY
jgi:hypothetical protein